MEHLFAPVPQRRRSQAGTIVSAALHVAIGCAAITTVSLGAFEPPRPTSSSITFVVAASMMPEIAIVTPNVAVPNRVATSGTVSVPPPEPEAVAASPVEPTPVVEPPRVDVPAVPESPLSEVRGLEVVNAPKPPESEIAVGGFNVARVERTRAAQNRDVVAAAQMPTARAASTERATANGAVEAAGFDQRRAAARVAGSTTAPERPVDVPVEIQFKPSPEYTDEARALRIQGDVILEVEFTAEGRVNVLRVVRGLGHGLDESAARAAAQIRFTPAQREGRNAGVTTTVHIVFRLA